jgi:hypothetical protein
VILEFYRAVGVHLLDVAVQVVLMAHVGAATVTGKGFQYFRVGNGKAVCLFANSGRADSGAKVNAFSSEPLQPLRPETSITSGSASRMMERRFILASAKSL